MKVHALEAAGAERGNCWSAHNEELEATVCAFQDSRVCYFLCTGVGAEDARRQGFAYTAAVKRWVTGVGRLDIECPALVKKYNHENER